jgi:hypothetical protein
VGAGATTPLAAALVDGADSGDDDADGAGEADGPEGAAVDLDGVADATVADGPIPAPPVDRMR